MFPRQCPDKRRPSSEERDTRACSQALFVYTLLLAYGLLLALQLTAKLDAVPAATVPSAENAVCAEEAVEMEENAVYTKETVQTRSNERSDDGARGVGIRMKLLSVHDNIGLCDQTRGATDANHTLAIWRLFFLFADHYRRRACRYDLPQPVKFALSSRKPVVNPAIAPAKLCLQSGPRYGIMLALDFELCAESGETHSFILKGGGRVD